MFRNANALFVLAVLKELIPEFNCVSLYMLISAEHECYPSHTC